VAVNGSTVLKLIDRKAGHTLAIAANGPTLDVDGAPNSKRCLVFDGVNDALFTASNIIPQPSTVITVHRQVTHANGDFIWDTNSGGARAALYQYSATPGTLVAAGNSIGSVQTLQRWDVVTTVHNTTGTSMQFNGAAAVSGSSASQTNARFALAAAANDPPSAGFCNIEIAEVLVFDSIIDAAALAQVRGYLAKKYGNIFQGHVVCDGNSLTSGSGAVGDNSYPAQLRALYGGDENVKITHFGVSGQSTRAMITDGVAQVDAVYNAERPFNILLGWEVLNDWKDYTVSEGKTPREASDLTITNYWTYLDARRSAGFRTVAFTVLPCTSYALGANETERSYVNAAIRAGWSAHASALVDVAADSRIGDDGDDTNLTYYNADGIHLNNAGYAVVAELAKAAVDSLL
jgi:lysophospholipase L1-like esterase